MRAVRKLRRRRTVLPFPHVQRAAHHRDMRMFLFALLVCARLAEAGLDRYSSLVREDDGPTSGGIRITYLGVNGYQLEAKGHVLLVDPYFSRISAAQFLFAPHLRPNETRVADGLRRMRPRADALLVTHAHVDHLFDAPPIVRHTGARLIAGPTAVNQMRSLGVPAAQCRAVRGGEVVRIGPWTVRVIASRHDRLFGAVPFRGRRDCPGAPPENARDWVEGETLAFIIEAAGRRIYIDAGGVPEALPPRTKVDLAILGVALPDARARFAAAVRRLRPQFTLPTHQDDFFIPAERGFVFAKASDFPGVLRTWQREQLPTELILLRYFRPWTLR
jgi:L-ascorbate metabolism protein UlaG (beta-lactamase superfamily)